MKEHAPATPIVRLRDHEGIDRSDIAAEQD
jgi:hypothetical protein